MATSTSSPQLRFVIIEQFSFECRKLIGFAITTLRDWLKDSHHFFIQSDSDWMKKWREL